MGARETAQKALEGADPNSTEQIIAWWTLGLAQRERSDAETSLALLTTAHDAAVAAGHVTLAAEVAVSLALQHAHRGESTVALDLLAAAEPSLAGPSRGRLLMQRALVHYRRGDLQSASVGYAEALEIVREFGDESAEARLCADLGLLETRQARFAVADGLLQRSMTLAEQLGQASAHAVAVHNWGFLAVQEGRLPVGLARLAQAEAEYRKLDNPDGVGLVEADRAVALACSGLSAESQVAIDDAIVALRQSGNRVDLADVLALGAELSALSGHPERGIRQAREATELCRRDGREIMAMRAELVALESEVGLLDEGEQRGRAVTAERAEELARRLGRLGWISDAAHGWAIVAMAADGSDQERADLAVRRFRRVQRVAPVHDRIRIKVLLIRRAIAAGQLASARRMITIGLGEVSVVAESLGALEMRAHIGTVATLDELAQLAFRLELASNDPVGLLRRSEQVRRTSVDRPLVQQDSEVLGRLAQLRVVNQELRSIDDSAAATRSTLTAQRIDLEAAIRRRALERSGASETQQASTPSLLRDLGDRRLLEYVSIDGVVHGLLAQHGRIECFEVGPESTIARLQEGVEFSLHRLNRSSGSAAARLAAEQALRDGVGELATLLVPAGSASSPTVVVPASVLYGVPWNAVVGAPGAAVCVAPSLTAWRRCLARSRDGRRRVIIGGPELRGVEREVEALRADGDGRDVVLGPARSDVDSCRRALAAADIAHIACHGFFRADNPMFSALRVCDGDLTVYDLEQCERLPHTVVLSACNAGQNAVLRGGALLGMASALIQLGVSSVIAPLSPVSDERSVEMMVRLHRQLASGVPPATALMAAGGEPDGQIDPTAAAFVCFGS